MDTALAQQLVDTAPCRVDAICRVRALLVDPSLERIRGLHVASLSRWAAVPGGSRYGLHVSLRAGRAAHHVRSSEWWRVTVTDSEVKVDPGTQLRVEVGERLRDVGVAIQQRLPVAAVQVALSRLHVATRASTLEFALVEPHDADQVRGEYARARAAQARHAGDHMTATTFERLGDVHHGSLEDLEVAVAALVGNG